MNDQLLWGRRDQGVLAALAVTGVGLWIAAWVLASGVASPEGQIGPASLAGIGIAATFAGGACWVAAGRRAVGRRIAFLLGSPPDRRTETAAADPSAEELVAGPGLRRFHRLDCPLAVPALDGSWLSATRAEHEAVDRQPCGVCRA